MSKISPVIIEEAFRLKDNEILRLRAENRRLRAALKPFAITSTLMEGAGDDELFTISTYIKDFRAAAAALKETNNA